MCSCFMGHPVCVHVLWDTLYVFVYHRPLHRRTGCKQESLRSGVGVKQVSGCFLLFLLN